MARHPLIAYALPRRHRLGNGLVLEAPGRERFLESIVVATIVAVLVALALASYTGIVQRISLYESANMIAGFRYVVAADFAVTGQLPETVQSRDIGDGRGTRRFSEIDWRDGEAVFVLGPELAELARLAAESAAAGAEGAGVAEGAAATAGAEAEAATPAFELSFRPALDANGQRLVFVCGHREPPPGFSAPVSGHTNVPAPLLPAICR